MPKKGTLLCWQSRGDAPCLQGSLQIRSPSGQLLTLKPAHSGVAAGQWQLCSVFFSQALLDPGVAHHACMGMCRLHERGDRTLCQECFLLLLTGRILTSACIQLV